MNDGKIPPELSRQVDEVASQGATPLVVCEGNRVAGVVVLSDILKPGMKDRFERLRRMGLRTVMVTGDNPADGQDDCGPGGRRRLYRPGHA